MLLNQFVITRITPLRVLILSAVIFWSVWGQTSEKPVVIAGSITLSATTRQVLAGQSIPINSTVTSDSEGTVTKLGPATFLRLGAKSELTFKSESEVTLIRGRLLARSDRELHVHAGELDVVIDGCALVSMESTPVRVQSLCGRVIVEGRDLSTVFGSGRGESSLALPPSSWAAVGQPTLFGIVVAETEKQMVLADNHGRHIVTVPREERTPLPGQGAVVEASLFPSERLEVRVLKVLGRIPGAEIPPLLLLRVLGGGDLLINVFPDGI